MAEKLFYSMGEVAEMFDVNPSLLRYWEEHFPQLRPKRTNKGNRRYTPKDVEVIKTIYHLVKERGMRIDGANKALREQHRAGKVIDTAQLLEHLQAIRAQLQEVREELKMEPEELIDDEPTATTDAAPAIDKQGKAVAVVVDEPTPSTEEKQKVRRPRKKKEGEKELFAFYEQSLF